MLCLTSEGTPLLDVYVTQDNSASCEEHDHRKNREPALSGHGDRDGEEQRSKDARKLLEHRVEAKELSGLIRRNEARKKRSAQRLGSSLDSSRQEGKNVEMHRAAHEVTENADYHVDNEADEYRSFGTEPIREAAEEKGAWDTDELHDQDCCDEILSADSDFCPVGCGHLDDGLNAVVVQQKRSEHQQSLSIMAQLTKRVSELNDRCTESLDWRLVRRQQSRWLRNAAKERQRKGHPPE